MRTGKILTSREDENYEELYDELMMRRHNDAEVIKDLGMLVIVLQGMPHGSQVNAPLLIDQLMEWQEKLL